MLALLLLSTIVATDAAGWLARADDADVFVSADAGTTWVLVHTCGDPLTEPPRADLADTICESLALTWHAGALYIACPNDGLYRWTAGAISATGVTESEAIADRCDDLHPTGPDPPSYIDSLTARSVFEQSIRPAPRRDELDVERMSVRARRARWLPRVALGLSHGRRIDWSAAIGGASRSSGTHTIELWVWLSWDLDRNHYLSWERLVE